MRPLTLWLVYLPKPSVQLPPYPGHTYTLKSLVTITTFTELYILTRYADGTPRVACTVLYFTLPTA